MADPETQTVPQATPPTGPAADAFRTLLEDAELQAAMQRVAALFDRPLCARCLGRPLSRAEKGLTNPEKGALVIERLALPHTEDPASCPWCEGLFEETPGVVDAVVAATAAFEFDTILLATRVHPDVQKVEKKVEAAVEGPAAEHHEPMKTELNRVLAQEVLPRLGVEGKFDRADLVALVDPYFDTVEVTTNACYLYGRYRKYDRTIPQTKWPCRKCGGRGRDCRQCQGTGQMYDTSVEALVAGPALEAFDALDESFHGAGREDIDALMLGTGRPFVLELKSPRFRRPRAHPGATSPSSMSSAGGEADATGRRPTVDDPVLDLAELQARINEHAGPRVEIEGLRFSDKQEVVHLKETAVDKAYRAHAVAEAPVERADLEEAIRTVLSAPLAQQTPKRVLHRRADKTRTRTVRAVEVASFGDHVRAPHEIADPDRPAPRTEGTAATHFTLDIRAEAGTYIKELVHSDEGRTVPSFAGLLGVPVRVVALDVVGVGEETAER